MMRKFAGIEARAWRDGFAVGYNESRAGNPHEYSGASAGEQQLAVIWNQGYIAGRDFPVAPSERIHLDADAMELVSGIEMKRRRGYEE
jgi:hypothetical protein